MNLYSRSKLTSYCAIMILGLSYLPSVLADMDKARLAYTSEDYDTAFSEFKAHAEAGNAEAQGKLGIMYFWGRGTLRSESKAYRWSLQAAKQGEASGQQMMGYLYENGIFIPKNMRRAVDWYRKSSKQGNAAATASLAALYVYGQGVNQDVRHGFRLAKKAAEENNSHAQYIVGHVYKTEYSDFRQAEIWFTKAAEQRYGEAANELGSIYFEGKLGLPNLEKAYHWFRIAEEYNSLEAPRNRNRVEKRMELDDLMAAEKLVQAWLDAREVKTEKQQVSL